MCRANTHGVASKTCQQAKHNARFSLRREVRAEQYRLNTAHKVSLKASSRDCENSPEDLIKQRSRWSKDSSGMARLGLAVR